MRDLEVVIGALETNGSLHDVFHAADDVRAERAGRPRAGGAEERLPLTGRADGWTARVVDALVARGAAGAVVVGVDDGAVRVRAPR